jgi:ATP citrate (pro-S)-lyase
MYQVGDLGYASELGNYAEYSGAPKEEEVLHYARVVLDVSSHYNPDHTALDSILGPSSCRDC